MESVRQPRILVVTCLLETLSWFWGAATIYLFVWVIDFSITSMEESVNTVAFTLMLECLELIVICAFYLSSSSEETVGVVSCSSTRHVRR